MPGRTEVIFHVFSKVRMFSSIAWKFNLSYTFFPYANEVWGKVIFLHLFVILFTGGRAWLWGVCMVAGGMHGCRGCAWLQGGAWLQWVCVVAGGHVWLQGGCVVAGGGMHRI